MMICSNSQYGIAPLQLSSFLGLGMHDMKTIMCYLNVGGNLLVQLPEEGQRLLMKTNGASMGGSLSGLKAEWSRENLDHVSSRGTRK